MKNEILRYISRLERDEDIKVLLAAESGSRSWGFPSADSDFDVRIIYVHKPEWYYCVTKQRDTIEYMSDDRLFDLSGWELRKALTLMSKTNPALSDWLFTDMWYKADVDFLADIRRVHDIYYNPVHAVHHFVSMAENFLPIIQNDECLTAKKYLYFLRAVLNCDYVMQTEKHPPVLFSELIKESNLTYQITGALQRMIEIKSRVNEKIRQLIDRSLIDYAMSRYNSAIERLSGFKTDWHFPDRGLEDIDRIAIKYITSTGNTDDKV